MNAEELSKLIEKAVSHAINSKSPDIGATKNAEYYLSRKEVANLFRISLPTLLQYTKTGKLKGHRIGRRVLFKPKEVEAALNPIK